MNKKDIYDKICFALTALEGQAEQDNPIEYAIGLLTEVQNNWEEIIGITED